MSRSMKGATIKPEDNGFVEGDRLTPEFPVHARGLCAQQMARR